MKIPDEAYGNRMNEKIEIGIINDIQRMCINDGPGFRTSVFLKGCYLNCLWCHNPEGKRRYPEVIPYVNNCNGCGDCIEVCTTGALRLSEDRKPRVDRGLCSSCMQCVKACRFDGLVRWGNIVTADEVIAEVEKEKPFYKHSGGGMTLTGGEPMAQPEFASALMEKAKALAIGTALDTCGYAPWEDFERVLKFTDLVLLDIKMMDSKAHRDFTGAGNELIHENARRMAEMGLKIRIRVPIIPGKNDSAENMKKTAVFTESLNNSVVGVDLLPCHPFAGGKYAAFGMEYQFPAVEEYDDERLESVVDLFLEHVCEVTIGG